MAETSSLSVKARGIRVEFGGVEVVKGVDLELEPGKVHAIIGENGAGKSTLAKVLAGVHRPSGGWVEVGGARIRIENPRHALQLGIALIHQEPLTFPDLDVAENIFVGHQPVTGALKAVDWRTMRAHAAEILEGLGVRLSPTARVANLSVADRQMVELAAALSHDARVLLMDETTAALTPKEVDELFQIVRLLRDRGCAIAFVSHRLHEVFEISDRITVLRDGEKVGETTPAETNVEEIVKLMVGRDLGEEYSEAQAASGGSPRVAVGDGGLVPVLNVRGLSVDGRFENVSFELFTGEILGIGGLVGAGRTDVCRALFGLARPSYGEIEIDGIAVNLRSPRDAMALGIALAPEDRQLSGLLMPMKISENATLAALRSIAKGGWLRPKAEKSIAEEALASLHTAFRSVSQPVRELSGGNQQKVVLAKWLGCKPRILILDEPTRGVDVGAKAEVHRLIRSLVAQGMAILMVSSDLQELLDLSDRVMVMREGRRTAEFDRNEATPERVMMAATGQGAA